VAITGPLHNASATPPGAHNCRSACSGSGKLCAVAPDDDDYRIARHKHVYSVTLGFNMASEETGPWVATCTECGYTERGDDSRSQIGISAWSGDPPGDSETTT
jgi:hypothetical protein